MDESEKQFSFTRAAPTSGRAKSNFLSVVLLVALMSAASAQDNLIFNGSFESPSLPGPGYANTTPSGWAWTPGDNNGRPDLIREPYTTLYPIAENGTQYFSIGSVGDGTLSQIVTISMAGNYQLTWYAIVANEGQTSSPSPYRVTFGSTTGQFDAGQSLGLTWEPQRLALNGLAAGSYTLSFTGLNFQGGFGSIIDDVQIQVPACQLNISNCFHQADSTSTNVPQYFGYSSTNRDRCSSPTTGQAKTSCYGCALCSLAMMLTAFPGLDKETPATLDMQLTNVNGYKPRADMSRGWCKIGEATGHAIGLISSFTVTDIEAYLTDHICDHGDGVILHFNELTTTNCTGGNLLQTPGGHYVLVTGRTNDDWVVFDPGWSTADPQTNLYTLRGHTNGFCTTKSDLTTVFRKFTIESVRTFRVGTTNKPGLCIQAQSPIELLVTDPSGKRVGWDGTNDIIEIGEASYFRDYPIVSADDPSDPVEGDPTVVKTAFIPNPVGGTYQVVATGTAAGAYTLDFQMDWLGAGGQTATYSGTAASGVRFTNTFFVIVPPLITGAIRVANGLYFSFPTQTNVTYFVEAKTDLTDYAWTPLQSVTGTGSIVTVTNTSSSASAQFYRVKSQ
jgi:hypothetical protein